MPKISAKLDRGNPDTTHRTVHRRLLSFLYEPATSTSEETIATRKVQDNEKMLRIGLKAERSRYADKRPWQCIEGPRQILELGSHNRTLCHWFSPVHTEPITNSIVQFTDLKLTTVDRCSSVNCPNEFLIGAVRRTAPITMLILNTEHLFLPSDAMHPL